MKTRFNVIVIALLAIMCMFSLMGCPKEAPAGPTYLTISGPDTIKSGEVATFTCSEAVSWGFGANTSDNDKNNDVDASNILQMVAQEDGSVKVNVIPGLAAATQKVRFYGTLKSDSYRYGWKEVTVISEPNLFTYTITSTDFYVDDTNKKMYKSKTDKIGEEEITCLYGTQDDKVGGAIPELFVKGPYYYAQNAGFFVKEGETGLGFYYYGASAELGYVSEPVKSYISIGAVANEKTQQKRDVEDVTTLAPSIKLTVNAKKLGTNDVKLAILDENNFCLAISGLLTDEAANYEFIVPANEILRITNGGSDGSNMMVYSINGEESTEAYTRVVGEPKVVEVKINGKDTVEAESTIPLTATVIVKAGASTDVVWSSSNTDVATVSETGVVTGCAGVTEDTVVTITATSVFDSSKSASFDVTVTKKSETEYQIVSWDFRTTQLTSVNIQKAAGVVDYVAGFEGANESSKTFAVEYVGTGTNGKLQYNASGYAQFNPDTQISFDVKAGDTVNIVAYPGQAKWAVSCGETVLHDFADNGAAKDDVTYTAPADGTFKILACGGAYIYAIEYKHPITKIVANWDYNGGYNAQSADPVDLYAVVGTEVSSTIKMTVSLDAANCQASSAPSKTKFQADASKTRIQFNYGTLLTIPVVKGDTIVVEVNNLNGCTFVSAGEEITAVGDDKLISYTATADGNYTLYNKGKSGGSSNGYLTSITLTHKE